MQRNFALFSARTSLHRCRFTENMRQLNRQLRRTKANMVRYVSLKADRELMSVQALAYRPTFTDYCTQQSTYIPFTD